MEERYKAENAPDGDDILQEWKEGPHRVIERRAGPGEEVRAFIRSVSSSSLCVCVCVCVCFEG